jgi:tRNA (pseudouridine54-N1)-methyltransferase
MRRFVIVSRTASASGEFSLLDIPGTSGRIDVVLRCVRAALLISHGVRQDTVVYAILQGGERAPRSVRIDGATARFLRPDERSLATLLQKSLAVPTSGDQAAVFTEVRPGVAVAEDGFGAVLADLGAMTPYLLDEAGAPLQASPLDLGAGVFFVGDHTGFEEASRALLAELGAIPVAVGPVSLHAEDAVAIVSNELDRRTHPRTD